MKRFLVSIALLSSFSTFSQKAKEKYPSKEENTYRERNRYKDFEPEAIPFIKNIRYDHVNLLKRDTKNRFVSIGERSSRERYYDSLQAVCGGNFFRKYPPDPRMNWPPEKYLKYEDSLDKAGVVRVDLRENKEYEKDLKRFHKCSDSIWNLRSRIKVAEVPEFQIVRYDSSNNTKILFYKSYEFVEFESSLWVAISTDNGQLWKKYFTGLIEDNFDHVKPNPKIRLIKNDSTIQVEIAIVRRMKEWVYLGLAQDDQFQLVEDNLVAELSLHRIVQDSDNDGLTNLLEQRLATNPFSKDSDNDGMEDAVDSNPRFRNVKTKYSNLFKFLIEYGSRKDSTFIPFDKYEFKKYESGKERIHFVVTDDANLQVLPETNDKYIFLSSKEFEQYQKQNFGSPQRIYVSPLFKIDGRQGVCKIHVSYGSYGNDYLIIEKKDGWVVKSIGSWIT